MNPPENPVTDAIRRRLLSDGPCSTTELATRLGVGVSTVKRGLRSLEGHLQLGRARATRHALKRPIPDVEAPLPVYELSVRPVLLGHLHPVRPDGFGFELPEGPPIWFDDLPWFLQDLRPAGYLGRQIPRLHPELGLPPDIHRWTADHTLRYLTRHGANGVGALCVGEEALLTAVEATSARLTPADFDACALDTLASGPVGSSAAGEQAKFIGVTEHGPVIVKFSPPRLGPAANRWADLLICEHLALSCLREAGRSAAVTHLHVGERVHLEVERFDRVEGHRIGQVSLTWVDAELVGLGRDWVRVMQALHEQGRVSAEALAETRWRQQFGRWIANTDMHLGNLSLRLDGLELGALCPTYDMLPMQFAPVAGEVVDRTFEPGIDTADGGLSQSVLPVAITFWRQAAADERISPGFREIAERAGDAVEGLAPRVRRLPRT